MEGRGCARGCRFSLPPLSLFRLSENPSQAINAGEYLRHNVKTLLENFFAHLRIRVTYQVPAKNSYLPTHCRGLNTIFIIGNAAAGTL